MAAKKTNSGAIIGVIGVVVVLWLLLHRKAAAAGSSGGGGGLVGGGGGGVPLPGQQQPRQGGGGGGLGLPSLGRSAPASSSAASYLAGWLSSVLNTGYANASRLEIEDGYEPGGAMDQLSIPYEPTALFPLDELTQDIPGYGDTGLDTIDTNISDGYIGGGDGLLPLGSYDIPGYGDTSGLSVDETNISDGSVAYDNSGFSGDFQDDTYDPWGSGVTDVGLLTA